MTNKNIKQICQFSSIYIYIIYIHIKNIYTYIKNVWNILYIWYYLKNNIVYTKFKKNLNNSIYEMLK